MSKRFTLIAAAVAALALSGTAIVPLTAQEKTVQVGGAPMYPSQEHRAERGQFEGPHHARRRREGRGPRRHAADTGPFTVFAPTNTAFGKLPAGTVDTLVKPENKATLTKILTYHVVPGRLTADDLIKAVKDGGGQAKLKTVAGDELTMKQEGPAKLWSSMPRAARQRHHRRRAAVERRHPRGRHACCCRCDCAWGTFRRVAPVRRSKVRQQRAGVRPGLLPSMTIV